MSTPNQPLHTKETSAGGQESSSCASRPQESSQPPVDRRGKLISEWSEFFSHRKHRRGLYLPLVRVDAME